MIKQSFEILAPYAQNLSELLSFNDHTDITNLAPLKTPEKKGFFNFILSTNILKLDSLALSKKIDVWSEYLLDQWISSSKGLNMNQLEKLKVVATKIFEEKKIELMKSALKKIDADDETVNTSLEKLQKRVLMILNPIVNISPHIATTAVKHQVAIEISDSPPDSDSPKYLQNRSFSDSDISKTIVNMHYDRRITRHINARILDIQIKNEKNDRLIKRMREIFERISSQDLLALAKAFADLKSPEEWKAFGKVIKPLQVINLLEICLDEVAYIPFIPRILINLSFSTLEDMLLGASHEQLHMINKVFRESQDVHQEWFLELFKKKRQNFVNISNFIASRIDNLDKRFRKIEPTLLTHFDVRQMDELMDDIRRHRNSYRNFAVIIKGAVKDHATLRLITGTPEKPGELEEEYRNHSNRMSWESEKYDLARGCPYEIIHGIIFHDCGCDDQDDAAEIFGAWGILSIEDYEEVGLINDIPEEVKRDWKKNPSEAHRLARFYAVKKLAILAGEPGMHTIKLWKHLRIYNKWMLKNYLGSSFTRKHLNYKELSKAHAENSALKTPTSLSVRID